MKLYKETKNTVPYLKHKKQDQTVEIWAYPGEVHFSASGPNGYVSFSINGKALEKFMKFLKQRTRKERK